MKIGDRVRVAESVVIYHNPQNRNEPFELKGLEGEVSDIILERDGKPISANMPILVQFKLERKFKVHLRESELEVIANG
ncbi:MAG: ferredoxin-thioredoxin reductase variable chain [Hormoscilla sp. GM7CHS1pb]|nr:ferredoxin-thioredoxin reductase variable chain [Hormoscilla sp. GM7CHS1pb]